MDNEVSLDFSCKSILYLCNKDKRLSKIIHQIGPISYSIYKDEYVFIIHEIIEQMLSVKVGQIIFNRLMSLCNYEITPQKISSLSIEKNRKWSEIKFSDLPVKPYSMASIYQGSQRKFYGLYNQ